MSIFLALLGLVGMTVFFIQFIVCLFKKKKLKQSLVCWIGSFIIAFVGILLLPPLPEEELEDTSSVVVDEDLGV